MLEHGVRRRPVVLVDDVALPEGVVEERLRLVGPGALWHGEPDALDRLEGRQPGFGVGPGMGKVEDAKQAKKQAEDVQKDLEKKLDQGQPDQ